MNFIISFYPMFGRYDKGNTNRPKPSYYSMKVNVSDVFELNIEIYIVTKKDHFGSNIIMKLYTSLIVGVCFIGIENWNAVTEGKYDWTNNFINYMQNYNKMHQTLILFNQEDEPPEVNEIIQRISRHISSLKINFQKVKAEQNLSKFQSRDIVKTTMINIIHLTEVSGNADQLNRMIDFTSLSLEARRRPKCLIVLPQEKDSFSYQGLLRKMWAKRFLDVTLLELPETKSHETKNFLKMQQDSKRKVPLIHQYNPFRNVCYTLEYSKSVSWFPEKTRNLQGIEMKVGLVHIPPFVFLTHNNKGDLIKESGLDVLLTKELSKAMNFRIVWDAPDNEYAWGSSSDCSKENSTGLISKLMYNELDFIGFENGRYAACYENLYEHSRGTKLAKVSIVVPIFRQKSDLVLTRFEIFNALGVVSMFLVTWLISYLLLRKPMSLNLLQIVSIVLGVPTPNEPQKLTNRIVFGSFLISCMIYASNIHTAFTEVNLQFDRKPEIENIEDILTSNLMPIIGKNYYSAFYEFTDGHIRLLLKKSNSDLETKDCLEMLLKEKNVVCVTRSEVANVMIEKNKDSCGLPVMKVLNEVLRSTVSAMNMEAGSPYVKRFDEIIQKLIESGLVDKWQRSRIPGSSVLLNTDESCAERGSETTTLKRQILYLFLFGYALATLAFFGEIIFAYFVK